MESEINQDLEIMKIRKYLLKMTQYILIGKKINIDLNYAYSLLKIALENNSLTINETIIISKGLIINQFKVQSKEESELNEEITFKLKKLIKYLNNDLIEENAKNYGPYICQNILNRQLELVL